MRRLRNDVNDIYDMLGTINVTLHEYTATLGDSRKLDHIIELVGSR